MFDKDEVYLRPVTALAFFTENKISLTSLEVCVSVDALLEGVAVFVIYVEGVGLPNTEITSRNGGCGSAGWAGPAHSDHWWMCGGKI